MCVEFDEISKKPKQMNKAKNNRPAARNARATNNIESCHFVIVWPND